MSENIAIRGRGGEASTFLTTAQVIQGMFRLMAAGKAAEAADVYSRCQEDIGFALINHAQRDQRQLMALANVFYRARDFDKAALCCENLGEFAKAAQLYEQADDCQSAAEMYAKVENFEKAAEMFERTQNFRQAAELFLKVKNFARAAANYERAVNWFVAGKLYHELGKFRKSMELLQKVQASDESFQDATLLIGDILAKNGYLDLAIKKLLNVIKGRPVGADTAELYYHLAGLHRQKGNLEVARNIYQQLQQFDIGYRDVEEKLQEMAAGKPVAPAVPAPEVPAGEEEEGEAQIVGVMEGFDFLQKIPLFADMPLAEMKAFYNICEERVFQDGERLIEQDRPGMALYVLREGTVEVQRVDGEKTVPVATLKAGDHVGEMALVDEAPTSARVVAQGTVRTFEISRDRFLRFLQSNEKFAVRVLRVFVRTLCQRLRETTARLTGR
ncbi:MAG: cyclic nucleotide-binding domain-containing protein [Myxococcales bacterium]|nr:cyclic nucleotide-binding domain-containing protein [Myxococcales bacterium]